VGDVSEMAIWRWRRDDRLDFPAPVIINGRNYWRVGDLRAWLQRRIAASAKKSLEATPAAPGFPLRRPRSTRGGDPTLERVLRRAQAQSTRRPVVPHASETTNTR
jgi:hypothetical protein